MDTSPASVTADASVEDVVKLLREHELPGVPVVDADGRLVGIVTEADLVLPDDQGDLHIPHYVNLFGGTVFLEPLGRFEKRLRKAFASTAADMMTADPDTVGPDATVQRPLGSSTSRATTASPWWTTTAGSWAWSRAWTCWAPSPGDRRRTRAGPHRRRRHRAQLPQAPRADRRTAPQLCAVVKADGYGHGAAPAADGGAAGRRLVARGGHRRRGARPARAGDRRAAARDGRSHPRRARATAVDADADVVVWTRELAEAAAALDGARVHVKLDTGMGRLGTKDVELARSLLGPQRGRRDDPLRDRRRARRRALPGTARALHRVRARRRGGRLPRLWSTRPTARPRSATRPRTSTWSAAASRSTAWTPSRATRASAASSRRSRWSRGWRRCGASRPATGPATDAAGGRASRPGWPRCRSATATAGGAGSRTTATC